MKRNTDTSTIKSKKKKSNIESSKNQKTPLHQKRSIPLNVLAHIESYYDVTVTLHQKNPNWLIRATHIIRRDQITNPNLMKDVPNFMKKMENFLDYSLKEIVFSINPGLDPTMQFIKSAKLSYNYDDLLVAVVFKINGQIIEKIYMYEDGSFHKYISLIDLVDANLQLLQSPGTYDVDKDIDYFIDKTILHKWVFSNCPFITSLFETNNSFFDIRITNCKIRKAINEVYQDNHENIQATLLNIKKYIMINSEKSKTYYYNDNLKSE